MTTFKNLTPHAIIVVSLEGAEVPFPPSGTVARVATKQEALPNLGGFAVKKTTFGVVENLPEPEDDVVFIVSALVLGQVQNRPDVVGPDTGPTAIRVNGQVVAVKGFVQLEKDMPLSGVQRGMSFLEVP